MSCAGWNTETLGVFGIDAALDGWKVTCKFTGPGGSVFTDAAVISVIDYTRPSRTLDEVLVRIMTEKPSGTAGASLAHARAAAQIADFFAESELSADEVREAMLRYTQHLSGDHQVSYKENVASILGSFRTAKGDPDSFQALLSDAGYEAKHFPWDDARVTACFEALKAG